MKTSSKEESKKDEERPYKVKSGAAAEFVILPGENPIEFELLRVDLAEEYAPEGPVEEDLVLTIAKCIWRKRRYQRFLFRRAYAAHFDPKHVEHHCERQALDTFYRAIDGATVSEEIQQALDKLPRLYADYLNLECPRDNFRKPVEWVEAMQEVVREALLPGVRLFALGISSSVITDDVFARELEFEERIDRTLEKTLDRLEKVKATKGRVSFREAQRLSRSNPGRLVRVVK
jgi:hypothetical protein